MRNGASARAVGRGMAILAAVLGCAAGSAVPAQAVPTLTPLITAAFGVSTTEVGSQLSLTFTIENPNAGSTGIALTGVSFLDELPAGLQVDKSGFVDDCGGTSSTLTTSAVGVAGIGLAADTDCVVAVTVTATAAGLKVNSVTVNSDQGTGNTSTATLDVGGPLSFAESFGATWIQPGGSTALKFAIGNPNDTKRTAISFSDPLPAGLRIATPNHLTGSCGGGTIAAAAGSASISLAGATIAASGNCAFSVAVTGSTVGAKVNTTGAISSHEDGAGPTATATVSVAKTGNRVFFTNVQSTVGNGVSFAALTPGGGGGDLVPDGSGNVAHGGVAIDVAAGRVYYADSSAATIPYARLDGGGAGVLAHPGVTTELATGMAIDPAAGRVYWADSDANKILFANLDGSGGGALATSGATVSGPAGVAIDPASGRIYWANQTGNTISFASLDGTGHGGDLNTSGATVDGPEGVAIDAAAGRIYWASTHGNTISYASLSGSGGGNLATPGVTVDRPIGVAIDHAAGLIYWANATGSLAFARLDGSGGNGIDTLGATVRDPAFPALLKHPAGQGRPSLSGGSRTGTVLRCSTGSWAPDQLGAFLYQAPQRFAYRWSRNGVTIAGATSHTFTARAAGSYRCTVTASSEAGSASQQSATHTVT